jgi:hypothetical protein
MREQEPRTKWFTTQPSLHDPSCGHKQTDLRGEDGILDLISARAPLAVVLNSLCTAIDLQVGNVVSVILLPDEGTREPQAMARGAREFGLYVFWSASIPLRDESVLGSFEMYCCLPRIPSSSELLLIQRATDLAGLAIRSHHGAGEPGGASPDWKSALERRFDEAAQWN